MRLQRIQAFLQPRQRIFLDALPLLVHCNHPLLPGYVSQETPAGIADYRPSSRELASVAKLSKSFTYKRTALLECPIEGLYLMGSVGSIAYSRKSDLDIWLCHRGDLPRSRLEQLRQKAALIEQWAESLSLEAHIFLIDVERFRRGEGCPLSKESAGSTQHYLLLEEFYRTGLYLAGRTPVWWLVPPQQENNYAAYVDHLMQNRFIDESSILDFGGLEKMPAGEFLGATLWHLYKAIHTPHKSLLKLLLMESYASEYPHIDWLCLELKRAVFDGIVDMKELDPYLLMYKKVEAFLLAQGKKARLALAMHCFYLKVNESPSLASSAELQYRKQLLQALVRTIGREGVNPPWLEERKYAKIEDQIKEQELIIQELTHSYQLLSYFARDHASLGEAENPEIKLLGRKLQAVLEKRPGKIEVLHRHHAVRVREEHFLLSELTLADGEVGWALYLDQNEQEPLKKARSLLEILAWIILNGFCSKATRFTVKAFQSALETAELRFLLDKLAAFLDKRLQAEDNLNAYAHPPAIVASMVYANLGLDTQQELKDGLHLVSNRFDALSYGAFRINLVYTLDQIIITSWQEVMVYRYHEMTGLCDCFCDLLNQSDHANFPEFHSYGFGSNRNIAARIKEIYHDLTAAFSPQAHPIRYLLRGGNAFYFFHNPEGATAYWSVPDRDQLLAELARPQTDYKPLVFDPRALEDSPLPALYAHNKPGTVQLFYWVRRSEAEVFLLDEKGALFQQTKRYINAHALLQPFALFLNSVTKRYVLNIAGAIEYFVIHRESADQYEVKRILFKPADAFEALDVRIVAEEFYPGQTAYTLYCDEREFSSMEYGDRLFNRVSEYIYGLRKEKDYYPIYITDMDVPLSVLGASTASQLQTVHFLNYKKKVEERLNVA